jgi:hypothetical protein
MRQQGKRRWEVLHELLRDKNPKVGAEIGIQRGIMTVEVLRIFPSIKTYYAIDPWLWYPEYDKTLRKKLRGKWDQTFMNKNFKEYKNRTFPFKNKIKTLKMFSNKAAQYIPDNSLDFCFIDGNHSKENVKEDINLYIPKMKSGGLLGGHDYGRQVGGVKQAVNEIFKEDEFFLGLNKTWWKWI